MSIGVANFGLGFRFAAFLERRSLWLYLGVTASLCAVQVYGYNADAIGLARAFYTAVIGMWFLLLSRIEPRRVASIVLGLFLLIFISAARPLGEYPTRLSDAMFLNRVGYALLFLIVFEQLGAFRFEEFDARHADRLWRRLEFWRGLSTGAALGCTVLVKISLVAPGAALLMAGILLFGIHRKHLIGMWVGALAMVVVAVVCMHFRPLPFLYQTLTLSHQHDHIGHNALHSLVEEIGGVVLALAAGLAVSVAGFSHRRIGNKYMLATVAIVASDVFCRSTNAMRSSMPLAAWWCLSGTMLLLSVPAPAKTARLQRIIALLILCPLTLPIFLMDSYSSMYAIVSATKQRNDHSLCCDSRPLGKELARADRSHSWTLSRRSPLRLTVKFQLPFLPSDD